MSAESEDAAELRLSLDWELWAIENLAQGAPPRDVVATLAAEGVDEATAEQQVAALCRSPALLSLRRQLARAHLVEQSARVRRRLVSRRAVECLARVDEETFFRDYWEPSRPLLITDALKDMRAVRTWSHDSLAERFGDVQVEVNVRRTEAARRSQTEQATARVSLGEFLVAAHAEEGNDRYIVSRNGLLQNPELAELVDDLTPLPSFLDPSPFPRGVSLWAGPGQTYSAPHFDPHNSLLVQVTGTKRIRLAPPELLALLDDMDGFYASKDLDDERLAAHPDFDPARVLSVDVAPGQALFIPVGWFHEVRALSPSLTLTFLSFTRENHFHDLRPR